MPNSNISIKRIFFCDTANKGQFGKINISGYISTKKIGIDQEPYVFDSTIVIEGDINSGFEASNLKVNIIMKDQHGQKNGDACITVDIPSCDQDKPLMLIIDLRFKISFGSMEISVIHNVQTIFSDEYGIVQEKAPNIIVQDSLAPSGMLSKVNTTFKVEDLFASASRDVIVVDQYLSPNYLLKLLSMSPLKPNVKVLTSSKYIPDYKSDLQNISQHAGTIEIRFIKTFHDRFVAINGSEYFHFGHSLKDLLKGRISRYSKIIDQKEIDALEQNFQEEWGNAEQLEGTDDSNSQI